MVTIGISLVKSQEIEYIFEISIASSRVNSGSIVENAFASIVFQLHGGHSIKILCHHAAAISRARLAKLCQIICEKSVDIFKSSQACNSDIFKTGSTLYSRSWFKIQTRSESFSILITSISGIIDASFVFSAGIKMRLNHFSFAHIVAGRTLGMCLRLPSRESSQRKILSRMSEESSI